MFIESLSYHTHIRIVYGATLPDSIAVKYSYSAQERVPAAHYALMIRVWCDTAGHYCGKKQYTLHSAVRRLSSCGYVLSNTVCRACAYDMKMQNGREKFGCYSYTRT